MRRDRRASGFTTLAVIGGTCYAASHVGHPELIVVVIIVLAVRLLSV